MGGSGGITVARRRAAGPQRQDRQRGGDIVVHGGERLVPPPAHSRLHRTESPPRTPTRPRPPDSARSAAQRSRAAPTAATRACWIRLRTARGTVGSGHAARCFDQLSAAPRAAPRRPGPPATATPAGCCAGRGAGRPAAAAAPRPDRRRPAGPAGVPPRRATHGSSGEPRRVPGEPVPVGGQHVAPAAVVVDLGHHRDHHLGMRRRRVQPAHSRIRPSAPPPTRRTRPRRARRARRVRRPPRSGGRACGRATGRARS